MTMDKTQNMLYEYAKERYSWEHNRKNDLNSGITIPLGIVTIQITGFSYFMLNFPKSNSEHFFFILFMVFLSISALSLIFSVALFIKHQVGYIYMHINPPRAMDDYRNEITENYMKENGNLNDDYVYGALNHTAYLDYVEATEVNIKNNDKKTQHHRLLLISSTISAIFLSLTFFIFLNLTF